MDFNSLFTAVKYALTAVFFIYLIRNTFKQRQIMLFIDNFHNKSDAYTAKISNEIKEKVDNGEIDAADKISFMIPLEDLLNGFGFHFNQERLDLLLGSKSQKSYLIFAVCLEMVVAFLIAYFLLGIPLSFIAFAFSGLIFLLLIV